MQAPRLPDRPKNGIESSSNRAGSLTYDFVSATNGKCHAISNKRGFSVSEDGDVGRRVVTLGIPVDAIRANVSYSLERLVTTYIASVPSPESDVGKRTSVRRDYEQGPAWSSERTATILTVRFETSDPPRHGGTKIDFW